ncbi:hypothetical protein ACA910_015626 [Epithemia clementina (nom. ined.)]
MQRPTTTSLVLAFYCCNNQRQQPTSNDRWARWMSIGQQAMTNKQQQQTTNKDKEQQPTMTSLLTTTSKSRHLFCTVQEVVQALGNKLKHKHNLDLTQRSLAALGITHQCKMTIAWNHDMGIPYMNAIV